jgi:type I restriction enzyme S subunit
MYWKTIHEQSSGIALANVNARKLEALELPLPPLAEQQRIVEAIEERFSHIDAGVALLKAARRKLRLYRASVLKAAVEGALTEQWRGLHPDIEPAPQLLRRILAERRARWEEEQRARGRDPRNLRYAEPAAPDTSRLPPLPDGWCWATIESISTKVVDGVHKKPDYVGKGIPFVTVRNLTAGPGISFEKLNYITEKDHIEFCKRANPERGDILITKDGTLGVVRAIRTDIQFSIFVSVSLIKPVMRIMSDYLEVALSSPQVQMQMIPKGSGLQHLHLEDLRMDCIPLPPLAEQEQIVALVEEQLSIIGNVEATIEHGLRRAERQRQSVLRQAFTGQLVPQDENDEPASVLLERIRGAMNRATTPGGSGERGQRGEGRERGQKKPGQPPRPAPARPPASIAPPGVDASNTVQPELWEGIEA